MAGGCDSFSLSDSASFFESPLSFSVGASGLGAPNMLVDVEAGLGANKEEAGAAAGVVVEAPKREVA